MDFVPCHLHLLFCDHVNDEGFSALDKGAGFPKGLLSVLLPDRPELAKRIEEMLSRRRP